MENTTQSQSHPQGGLSDFIKDFFNDLKISPDYAAQLERPFDSEDARTNLFSYLDMDVIGKYLLILKRQTPGEINTFMSNGLEWVNGTVSANENGVKEGNAKEAVHLYINLLALLVSAPTTFMKIGALTMYSIAADTTKNWI